MDYPLLKMAMMMAAFQNPDIPMEGKCEDTSATRKDRKERVLTMIHEEKLKGKDRKRRLPRSKRKGCSIPAKSK